MYVAVPEFCVLTEVAGIQFNTDFCIELKCIVRTLPMTSNGSPYSLTLQLPPITWPGQYRLPACQRVKLCPSSWP